MPNGLPRRRAAAPIALFAALAIAAGGGSAPWSLGPAGTSGQDRAAAPVPPAVVQLEHLELVAVRAQSDGATALPRLDPRRGTSVVAAGVAAGIATTASDPQRLSPMSASATGPDLRSHPGTPGSYAGRNRMWIPSLGMSQPVRLFPCSRSRAPDNYMYRWGCAGANNVYLLGHAWGVMKPLHDAYEAGRLHVGMRAFYADGEGRIRAYEVTSWRVVNPVDSHWAIASQPVPSMTLQTCVGPRGTLRLNVRLVEVPA